MIAHGLDVLAPDGDFDRPQTRRCQRCPDCVGNFRSELVGLLPTGSVCLPLAKAAYRVRLPDVEEAAMSELRSLKQQREHLVRSLRAAGRL